MAEGSEDRSVKQDSNGPASRKAEESSTVRRELDQIARQLKGLSDRVKRLKEQTT